MRVFILMICMLVAFPSVLAQESYVNIFDLRVSSPKRLQKECVTQEGDCISIDAPVIIPDVSVAPIVRVTWGGPLQVEDASLKIVVNDENVLQIDHEFQADAKRRLTDVFKTVNDDLLHIEAVDEWLKLVSNAVPSLATEDLECINSLSYAHGNGEGGFYMLFFAKRYHGIPYLCNVPYAVPLKAETQIPYELSHGCIEDREHYNISLSVPEEIGIVEEDVPLLPFSEIEKIISERIIRGYVNELDEIRFGYRIFVDPDREGEFLLVPVWCFSGSMRASLDVPFVEEEVVFMPYKNLSSFAVNAQTGEVYTWVFEKSKDRLNAPDILTWEEVR